MGIEIRILGYVITPEHCHALIGPWSSWRFYFWNDASILLMDKML